MSSKRQATGIVILAAGASTRMGKPKQLLDFQGETLIVKVVKTALATPCRPIVVVLGAYYNEIVNELNEQEILHPQIIMIENKDWQQGMSTSVKLGLKTLLNYNENIDAALFLVADQPFLKVEYLLQLLAQRAASSEAPASSILASFYNNRGGVPALFDQKWFPELLQLRGDQGARTLLELHKAEVATMPFPQGAFDVDTPADYQNFLKLGPPSKPEPF